MKLADISHGPDWIIWVVFVILAVISQVGRLPLGRLMEHSGCGTRRYYYRGSSCRIAGNKRSGSENP